MSEKLSVLNVKDGTFFDIDVHAKFDKVLNNETFTFYVTSYKGSKPYVTEEKSTGKVCSILTPKIECSEAYIFEGHIALDNLIAQYGENQVYTRIIAATTYTASMQ